MNEFFTLICPCCGKGRGINIDSRRISQCSCSGAENVQDGSKTEQTMGHYTLQWGSKLNFLDFLQKKPDAKKVLAAAKLGWNSLFEEIQKRAEAGPVSVYDAACGFGGIANELINEKSCPNIRYCGVDIHDSLDMIVERIPLIKKCGVLLQWDISNELPLKEKFDYVLCRASIHHTPDPYKTFLSLCKAVKPGGIMAVSAYAKKGICREANDNALRSVMTRMDSEEAFAASKQFMVLGKTLQKINETFEIEEDLPLLGIKMGKYQVQDFIYRHFLKCFYNPEFGDEYSTLVNYDWYHPEFAYRYEKDELLKWFSDNDIDVTETTSSEAQHYIKGIKRK